jgi:hypothetical protein
MKQVFLVVPMPSKKGGAKKASTTSAADRALEIIKNIYACLLFCA